MKCENSHDSGPAIGLTCAPAPPGLEHALGDLLARHRHEPDLAVALEGPGLIR